MTNVSSSYTDSELANLKAAAKIQMVSPGRLQKVSTMAEVERILGTVVPPAPNNPPFPGAYTMILGEDFTSDLSHWNVLNNSTYGSGNNEEQRYMTDNVELVNGVCRLVGKQEVTAGGYQYTSGMITTRAMEGKPEKFSFLRGYAEIRARFPKGGGYWPAFWLVGATGAPPWPAYGEVDIVEWYGTVPTVAESNFHKTGGNIGAGHHTLSPDGTNWHTYGINWMADRLEWWYDGKLVRTYIAMTDADRSALGYKHTIHINLAIGGNGPRLYHGWKGDWKDGEIPGAYEIDYVRVWQKAA